ncbi:hypothetical protein BGZ51_009825 [Haplosporangium sp. Z 767]|nr:hypothetical protein BGZ50_002365 [Haplosporangium sp. Z 11]KAF9189159.1 hypothetical protein BGZ51_009825 [Haplosporangium sp. Z 767]
MLSRSIAITRSSIARATLSAQQHCHRSFSVSAAANAKKQFIVIARDYQDEEAQNRRMEVRPKHLEGARALKKSGTLQLGGALLSDHSESGKMIGSIMIFSAESEAEVAEIVEKDQYVTGKVWEHYQILPFRQAVIDP